MFLQILLELIVGYIALFIIVKVLGKTQLSQITPFDFISALVMGEFVGSAIFDEKVGTFKIIFAILVWGMLIYLTEVTTQKSRRLRMFFEGKPAMLINKGNLDWDEMKKNQIDIDQLQQMLRSKDVFSIQEVEYAILENNGSISVLRKSEADQPTCKDLHINGEERSIPYTFISDGVILDNNLEMTGVKQEWIYSQLKRQGFDTPKQVSYAEYHPGEDLYIQAYNT